MSIQVYEDANFMRMSLGDFGFDYIQGSGSGSDFYGAIQALEETTISISNHIEGKDVYTISNLVIPAGFIIFGNLTITDITTGSVIAYKRG